MKSLKKIAIVVFCAAALGVGVLTTVYYIRKDPGKLYKTATSVSALEKKYGKPYYNFRTYPPMIGQNMLSEDEFVQGYRIRVYWIKSMPNMMAIIKYRQGSDQILDKQIYIP